MHFPTLSAASFPGCCCVLPSCSPLGQQEVLEELKCVLKLAYGFIYFELASSGFLWLQADWHMAAYLSCGFFWTIYIWNISPKTGQKGLFGGFCLFICFFLKNHFIFLHLSEFCYSFIFPVTLVAQDYFLLDYCFLCNLSKTLDSPNKILKGEGAHGFHLL